MKLLIVTRSIPLHDGAAGMERVAWDIARSLSADHHVEILTTIVPGQATQFVHDGVRVTTLPRTSPGRYSASWWKLTARYRAARQFDTVLSVSAGATAMVRFQRGPKYVFQAHGTALNELRNVARMRRGKWLLKAMRYAWWILLDSLTYRKVDSVVAASDQVALHLRRPPYSGAWQRTKLVTIVNAVDTAFFSFDQTHRLATRATHGVPAASTVITTVSRLDRQKGVDRVVASLRGECADVRLIAVGAGPEKANLIKNSDPRRAVFIGKADREGVRDVLAAADLFILPVRNFQREALPLSVLEALAMGLRVIVPIESSWPDELAIRLDFIDFSSPEYLANAITAFEASPGDRASRLPDSFSFSGWTDQYLDVLN